MGDYFQSLAAPDVSASEAQARATRMLSWLIAQGIVSPEKKDCVLGAETGYPPGRQYALATGKADPHLLHLRTNGMEVITKRTVFDSGQGGFELICSACGSRFEPPDRWSDAVGERFNQSGGGDLACPDCGISRSIAQWRHDPPWAFADLGFKFWNWPHFPQTFVDEFEKQLGSRVVHVYGKL